jgi:hypothetical protein
MVYNNVPYLDYEEQKIAEMKDEISKTPGLVLPDEYLISYYG